ncbi:hypothetical protein PR048_016176 [Dryococelus australis]|uniref:Uncharacterized protein n=1 Tax=Dryococelus australis TaxID=614101 RepID=A0ABQ9HJE2_9NEOP|nr:hypothetical protein PR048_016176 [Dryococelus australis]
MMPEHCGYYGGLRRTAQQAPGDVQLGRRHVETAFRHSTLPSYRRREMQPGLTPYGWYRPFTVNEVSTEQRRNARAGENGDPRGNPLTSDIARHDTHVQKFGAIPPEIEPSSRRQRCVRMDGDEPKRAPEAGYSSSSSSARTQTDKYLIQRAETAERRQLAGGGSGVVGDDDQVILWLRRGKRGELWVARWNQQLETASSACEACAVRGLVQQSADDLSVVSNMHSAAANICSTRTCERTSLGYQIKVMKTRCVKGGYERLRSEVNRNSLRAKLCEEAAVECKSKHKYPEQTRRRTRHDTPHESVREEIWAAINSEALRADEGGLSEYGATSEWRGDPRENPPTNGIVRYESHLRKSGEPAGDRTWFALVRGERPNRSGHHDLVESEYGAASECSSGRNKEIPEKTHRPAVSSGTISTSKNLGPPPPRVSKPVRLGARRVTFRAGDWTQSTQVHVLNSLVFSTITLDVVILSVVPSCQINLESAHLVVEREYCFITHDEASFEVIVCVIYLQQLLKTMDAQFFIRRNSHVRMMSVSDITDDVGRDCWAEWHRLIGRSTGIDDFVVSFASHSCLLRSLPKGTEVERARNYCRGSRLQCTMHTVKREREGGGSHSRPTIKDEVEQLPMENFTCLYNVNNSLKSSTDTIKVLRKVLRTDEAEVKLAPECKGAGNGKSLRKPANQRNRPTRFPQIRKSASCPVGNRAQHRGPFAEESFISTPQVCSLIEAGATSAWNGEGRSLAGNWFFFIPLFGVCSEISGSRGPRDIFQSFLYRANPSGATSMADEILLRLRANPLRLLGRKIMQGDMHCGKEGLGSHGLHFGAMTTSLSVLRASLNYEEQGEVFGRLSGRSPPSPPPGQAQIHPKPATPRVNTVRSQYSGQTAVPNDPLKNSGHDFENRDCPENIGTSGHLRVHRGRGDNLLIDGAAPERKGGGTGVHRENPPKSGIVRYGFHLRKYGSDPAGDWILFDMVGGEQSNRSVTEDPMKLVMTDSLRRCRRRCTLQGSRVPADKSFSSADRGATSDAFREAGSVISFPVAREMWERVSSRKASRRTSLGDRVGEGDRPPMRAQTDTCHSAVRIRLVPPTAVTGEPPLLDGERGRGGTRAGWAPVLASMPTRDDVPEDQKDFNMPPAVVRLHNQPSASCKVGNMDPINSLPGTKRSHGDSKLGNGSRLDYELHKGNQHIQKSSCRTYRVRRKTIAPPLSHHSAPLQALLYIRRKALSDRSWASPKTKSITTRAHLVANAVNGDTVMLKFKREGQARNASIGHLEGRFGEASVGCTGDFIRSLRFLQPYPQLQFATYKTHATGLWKRSGGAQRLNPCPLPVQFWTTPLGGGFARGPPVSPALAFRRCCILTSITLIVSQDLVVKNRPNLTTPSSETSAAVDTDARLATDLGSPRAHEGRENSRCLAQFSRENGLTQQHCLTSAEVMSCIVTRISPRAHSPRHPTPHRPIFHSYPAAKLACRGAPN